MKINMKNLVGEHYKIHFDKSDLIVSSVCYQSPEDKMRLNPDYKLVSSIFKIPVEVIPEKVKHTIIVDKIYINVPRALYQN